MTPEQAVKLVPDDHPKRPTCLNHLVISLRSRFEQFRSKDVLNRAIREGRAVPFTTEDHPGRCEFLNNLGIALDSKFNETVFRSSDHKNGACTHIRSTWTLAILTAFDSWQQIHGG